MNEMMDAFQADIENDRRLRQAQQARVNNDERLQLIEQARINQESERRLRKAVVERARASTIKSGYDYGKAIKKLKLSEYTSDLQTESEDHHPKRRSSKKPSRYVESDEESLIDDSRLPRPAKPSSPPLNDDYGKAIKKLKLSEYTSDLQTESEDHHPKRRSSKKPSRYVESDEESLIDDSRLPRPAKPSSPPLNVIPATTSTPRNVNTTISEKIIPAITSTFQKTPTSITADKLLAQLLFIREQNKQIIEQNNEILVTLKKEKNTEHVIPNLPVALPIKKSEELHELCTYVTSERNFEGLTRYLSTVGGANLVNKVNNIMKRCLSNKLMTEYSYRGKRGDKRAFEDLSLKNVIVCAAKLSHSTATEKEIEDIIKTWLKHAPQRNKAEEVKRRNGGENH
ncbi:hypothetical protein FQR65_LT15320 [Abscondita terminalis]|nr:hypothetical protein FQR65_LT15320 [Abscondita terminalis]